MILAKHILPKYPEQNGYLGTRANFGVNEQMAGTYVRFDDVPAGNVVRAIAELDDGRLIHSLESNVVEDRPPQDELLGARVAVRFGEPGEKTGTIVRSDRVDQLMEIKFCLIRLDDGRYLFDFECDYKLIFF